MSGGTGVDRRELGEATSHGQLYVDRLRSAHLTLSGVALVAFGGLVGALPLVALAWPSIESRSVAGVPLGVLLLLAPYPVFVVIGAVYARRADGLDDTFSALMDDGGTDDAGGPGRGPARPERSDHLGRGREDGAGAGWPEDVGRGREDGAGPGWPEDVGRRREDDAGPGGVGGPPPAP